MERGTRRQKFTILKTMPKVDLQKQIIYNIVAQFGPLRTEQIKIRGMSAGVSCADRYLRWLENEKKLKSYYRTGKDKKGRDIKLDKTKTWELYEYQVKTDTSGNVLMQFPEIEGKQIAVNP